LPTYRSGNGSREAVNGEVARLVLEDGEGSFRCKSGSDDGSESRSDVGRSFPKQHLDTGCLGLAGRQCELGWLGFGWQ
jgi:hypothetical protein